MQKTSPESLDTEAQDNIKQARSHQAAHGGRNAPRLHTVDDRCDECKRGSQENRHHSFRDELEDEGARTRGKQRHIGVQPRQERDENQSTKSDKHHLSADKAVF